MLQLLSYFLVTALLTMSGNLAAQATALQQSTDWATHACQKVVGMLHTKAPDLHMLSHMTTYFNDAIFYEPNSSFYHQHNRSHLRTSNTLNGLTAALGLYSLAYHEQDTAQKIFRTSSVLFNILMIFRKNIVTRVHAERDQGRRNRLITAKKRIEKLLTLLEAPALGIPLVWMVQSKLFNKVCSIFLKALLKQFSTREPRAILYGIVALSCFHRLSSDRPNETVALCGLSALTLLALPSITFSLRRMQRRLKKACAQGLLITAGIVFVSALHRDGA